MYGIAFLLFTSTRSYSQEIKNYKDSEYRFNFSKQIPSGGVKDQCASSTCWSFSSLSFFESEMVRMKKPSIDLSEMFVVRNIYSLKAEKYVRMMGTINFGPGGAFHDVLYSIKNFGLVPDENYRQGLHPDGKPWHGEIDNVLKAMLDEAIKLPNKRLNPNWRKAYEGALDGYFGTLPNEVSYNGKNISPRQFANETGINPDDYIELTSFSHHPYYEKFILEVPDNWAWQYVYNVTLDELESIARNALQNGYGIAWAADVSEPGFSMKKGLAVVHENPFAVSSDMDSLFLKPGTERTITQEIRQKAFDDLSTQDDHGMHITGLAKDQTGKEFFYVKNSWGEKASDLKGYFFCSMSYFRFKTTSIMVHKDAIPAAIMKKLKTEK